MRVRKIPPNCLPNFRRFVQVFTSYLLGKRQDSTAVLSVFKGLQGRPAFCGNFACAGHANAPRRNPVLPAFSMAKSGGGGRRPGSRGRLARSAAGGTPIGANFGDLHNSFSVMAGLVPAIHVVNGLNSCRTPMLSAAAAEAIVSDLY